MTKADSNRLLKALLISIMFHTFMFAGMNLLDWFHEIDLPERLAPVSIRIEKESLSSAAFMEEEITPVSTEIPEQQEPAPNITQDTAIPSYLPSESSPYDDMFTTKDVETPVPFPELIEETGKVKDFKPKESEIVYEEYGVDKDSSDVIESASSGSVSDTGSHQVISAADLDKFSEAIAGAENQDHSDPAGEQKSDYGLTEYDNDLVKFDKGDVKRELVANPPPEMPDDLPSDFPPEITYKIRFSLNTDGLIKVLSIDPSSVYPRIDASIRKALRSWSFNRSTGSEVVEGTITLIFKAK